MGGCPRLLEARDAAIYISLKRMPVLVVAVVEVYVPGTRLYLAVTLYFDGLPALQGRGGYCHLSRRKKMRGWPLSVSPQRERSFPRSRGAYGQWQHRLLLTCSRTSYSA